jgi:hypothetical protein
MWVSGAGVAPDYNIHFYANDELGSDASSTGIRFLGGENLQAEFVTVVNQPKTWIADIGGLSIPYVDEDDSGEFHVEVQEINSSAHTQLSLAFNFLPSYPA